MPPRRPQSKQKLPGKQAIQKKPPVVEDDGEAMEKFQVEVKWCLQQLEASMQKTSLKEKEDMAKAHRTLTSSKATHIKKRQVMNSLFGDYRTKMAEEEAKIKIEKPKIKKQSVIPSKSMFVRKSTGHQVPPATITTTTTTGPLVDSHEKKSQVAEETDQNNLPGSGSSSTINTKEQSGDEGTSCLEKCDEKLLKENSECKKILSKSFKFQSQSRNTFKFDFSSVS